MEYLRHKSFDSIIKLEKGKITGRLAQIQNRHDSSKKVPVQLVSQVDSYLWKVKSETTTNKYTIQEDTKTCLEKCQLKCNECDICVHLFSCTCPTLFCNTRFASMFFCLFNKLKKQTFIKVPDQTKHDIQCIYSNLNMALLKEVTPPCCSM